MLVSLVLPAQEQERGLKYRVGATSEDIQKGRQPQLWGVVIGISQYQRGDEEEGGNRINNLKFADDDAKAMYDFLRSETGGGFKAQPEGGHLILLTNEQATHSAVRQAMETLKAARPEDYFVIYIAAHGVLGIESGGEKNRQVPYFVLHDTNLGNLRETAIRMEDFKQLVRSLKAQKGLVIADTCHSAGVMLEGRGLRANLNAQARLIEEMKAIPRGVGFIAASDEVEASRESRKLQAGIFTWYLLEGLRGNADADGNGLVTFREIKSYLRAEVPKRTENRQNPAFYATDIEANNLPLSLVSYAGAPPLSATAPELYGLLTVRTPDIDGVEVVINDAPVGVMSSALEKSIKVPAGSFKIRFTKGSLRQERQEHIVAGEARVMEVNLTFTQEDDTFLLEPPAQTSQLTVYLTDTNQPDPEAKKLFQKGADLFNKQQLTEAIAIFNRAIQANGGTYLDALVYRGRAEQALGQNNAAWQSFNAALALRPSDYETRTLRAEVMLEQGRVSEAIAELRAIIAGHPKFDFARVVLADALLAQGHLKEAERQSEHATALNPNSPPAYLILADVLLHQPDLDKQKAAIEKAQQALHLFETLARKQVSLTKGVRYLSLSHIIFGAARYANQAALAEAHSLLAKALTLVVENHDQLNSAEKAQYLTRAQPHLQEALRLSKSLTDPHRYVLTLEISARHALLRSDLNKALMEAETSLRLCRNLARLQGCPEAHYTLYGIHKTKQEYAKAVESLKNYLALVGSRLLPPQRQELQEEIYMMERHATANRKKR
jgi:uncharacterized caspase-like protein/tetratricopeptide (TPR) repeat protein